jgi:hypothetical protein
LPAAARADLLFWLTHGKVYRAVLPLLDETDRASYDAIGGP